MAIETICLSRESDDLVAADFSAGVNRLLIDELDYGFALSQTLKVLNITPDIPNPRRMLLRGSVQDAARYIPWLEQTKYRIAASSAVEQSMYKPKRANAIRDAVSLALYEVLETLPQTVVDGDFADICGTVIKPFAGIVLPPDSELIMAGFEQPAA